MKITEIQRQQIIATYVAGKGEISQAVLAEKYGVTRTTISKILKKAEVDKILTEKRDQSVLSMLEYIDSKQNVAQELMNKILSEAGGKIKGAQLRDLMGALKILADVFSKSVENKDEADDSRQVVFKIVGVKNEDATN